LRHRFDRERHVISRSKSSKVV